MHRRVLGVAVAFVLAAGALVVAPVVATAKGRTTAKQSSAKKSAKGSTKSSSKAVSKKSAARSNNRASARAGKRGKNASDKDSRTAGRREERRPTYARKPEPRPSVAKSTSDTDTSEDAEEDDTPTLRPANRYVGDISATRVIEIQNALIKAGSFPGPATGVYDQSTFDAMMSFQSRRGFGATGMPTAEALKALGVRKNSGIGISTPQTVVRTTTPNTTSSVPSMTQSSPNR